MNPFHLGQIGHPAEGVALPYLLGLALAAVAVALLLVDRARLARKLKTESTARQEAEARAREATRKEAPAEVRVPLAADPALLDPSRIEELRALGARTGRDLLGSLAALFRESSSQQLAELRLAFEAQDPQAAQRAAHTLKSSAGNIGAKEIAELARQIEEAGRQQAIEAARPRFDRLEGQLPRVADELERIAAAR